MLIEIKCDQFKTQPKQFFPGLNIVVGSDDGGNSIGKSTFLMIVDFVFGGSDYIEKSTDVQANIGIHDICFAFKFDGKITYFCRNTLEKNIIYLCDELYVKKQKISIEEYLVFLKNQYKLNYCELSFRNEVSRFFRIYGRENLQEKKPLHLFHAESEQKCIDSMLKLFNKYDMIKEATTKYIELENEKKAIMQAGKYNLIKNINECEYKSNIKTLKKLKDEIAKILSDVDAGIKDVDSTITDEILRLKKDLSRLRISRSRNIHEKNKLRQCTQSKITEAQLKQLKEFFPYVDLTKIDEFEHFHENIKNILNDEIKMETDRYSLIIDELTKAIDNIEKEIKERSTIKSLSQNVLLQLVELQKKEEELSRENELYEKFKAIKKSILDLREYISNNKIISLDEIETQINIKMEALNDFIYEEKNKAPILKLKDSSYRFTTPDDTGTGTSYKSMLVYDLAILELSALPLLIHDSFLLKQIQDKAVEKILELYEQAGKQIFISIDKVSSLTLKAVQIIKKAKILTLYPNGGELFGRCWNKKRQ